MRSGKSKVRCPCFFPSGTRTEDDSWWVSPYSTLKGMREKLTFHLSGFCGIYHRSDSQTDFSGLCFCSKQSAESADGLRGPPKPKPSLDPRPRNARPKSARRAMAKGEVTAFGKQGQKCLEINSLEIGRVVRRFDSAAPTPLLQRLLIAELQILNSGRQGQA